MSLGYASSLVFAWIYWMLLSAAWLLTLVTAAIAGVIAGLVTWNLWRFGIVLVTGSLLGWLATLAYFFVADVLWWLRSGRETEHSDLIAWGVGPAVVSVVALVVLLAW